MTRSEAIIEACRTRALVYRTIGNYEEPCDGFCDICAKECGWTATDEGFRCGDTVTEYIRMAVLEKLKRDGYEISKGFDPNTGKEIPR